MKYAKRMENFEEGIFMELAKRREALRAKGMKVVDLSVGTPNIPPAPHIIEAMVDAVSNPANYVYAISDLDELHDAVAQWYGRRYGVRIDPKTQVVAVIGTQEGLSNAFMPVIDPGDTIIVPDPCYPAFATGAQVAGAELFYVPQRPENGYIIDFADIPESVAKKAKAMIVSYPNNPTTAVAPPEFYQKLIEFAKKYDIFVVHDNAYSELTFDGVRCSSFLAYPGAMEVGIEFNSLSKTYGLAGARIGFALGNAEYIKALTKYKSNVDYGLFLPVQRAGIAALTGPQDCVAHTAAAYGKRRDLLLDGLRQIGWDIPKPKATMFVWAPIPAGFESCVSFTFELMEKTGVIVVPGTSFGQAGEGHVRMALVQDEEDILYAIHQIKKSGILNR